MPLAQQDRRADGWRKTILATIFTCGVTPFISINFAIRRYRHKIRGLAPSYAKRPFHGCTIFWHTPVYALQFPENTHSKTFRFCLT